MINEKYLSVIYTPMAITFNFITGNMNILNFDLFIVVSIKTVNELAQEIR